MPVHIVFLLSMGASTHCFYFIWCSLLRDWSVITDQWLSVCFFSGFQDFNRRNHHLQVRLIYWFYTFYIWSLCRIYVRFLSDPGLLVLAVPHLSPFVLPHTSSAHPWALPAVFVQKQVDWISLLRYMTIYDTRNIYDVTYVTHVT